VSPGYRDGERFFWGTTVVHPVDWWKRRAIVRNVAKRITERPEMFRIFKKTKIPHDVRTKGKWVSWRVKRVDDKKWKGNGTTKPGGTRIGRGGMPHRWKGEERGGEGGFWEAGRPSLQGDWLVNLLGTLQSSLIFSEKQSEGTRGVHEKRS